MWRYGGGDWTLPFRVYHGLDAHFRPVGEPDAPARPIRYVERYRHLLYGFAKAAAIIEEGVKDKPPPRPPRRPDPGKPREQVTPGGVVLPTGTPAPPR